MRGFWKYDLFPYVLSGTVSGVGVSDTNLVQTVEFGKGHFFRPMIILPDDEGKVIADKLAQLREQYDQDVNDLREKYIKLRNEAAPFMANSN